MLDTHTTTTIYHYTTLDYATLAEVVIVFGQKVRGESAALFVPLTGENLLQLLL